MASKRTRYRVAEWRLDKPLSADLRAHDDAAAFLDLADDDRVLAILRAADDLEHSLGLVGLDADDRLALVGDFHGVDAQHVGRGPDVRRNGSVSSSMIDLDTPLFFAISFSTFATPPLVGSFMAVMPPTFNAASMVFQMGATSDFSSVPNLKPSR